MCPKGDDPFTPNQQNRTIKITTSATSGVLSGQFKLTFQGQSFYFNANASKFTAANCITSFQNLPNIDQVYCTRTTPTTKEGATYTIQFVSFPIFPYENNIFSHDFQCDTSLVTTGHSPTCSFSDVVSTNIKGKLINTILLLFILLLLLLLLLNDNSHYYFYFL